jgi:hypothetical protein
MLIHIIGMELMGAIRTIGSKLAWLLLLPGNSACRAMGLKEAESSDLIRMLVNSLAWTIIGVAVVSALA